MKVSHQFQGNVCIISLNGNLALDEVNEARFYWQNLWGKIPLERVLLNMEEINYIDSSGIGFLVGMVQLIQEKEGSCALYNLRKKHLELFRGMSLESLFEIYNTIEEALDSLATA